MKMTLKRLIAAGLAAAALTGGAAAARAVDTPNAGDLPEITTKFDYIMQFVDWFSLEGEGQDVLRAYFNQYFARHPEELVPLVNDIMQSIDSHSMYMSAEEYAKTFGVTLSDYVGIGIQMRVAPDGAIVVERAYRAGPAYAAGIRAGDILVSVAGQDARGLTPAEVSALAMGEPGTTVEVVVSRGGQQLTFKVERASVTPEHVSSEMLEPGIAYIRVSAMGSQTDSEMFVEAWESLAADGARAAILDLRGNGGGLIDMAQRMIETIAPQKDEYYLGLRYRDSEGGLQKFYTPGSKTSIDRLVVLVDGNTASAAEIVSGSLSDLGLATLVGDKTYGKGVGQYHFKMPDESVLILTSLEIQLPVRGTYEGEGITPDILVENTVVLGEELSALDTGRTLLPGTASDAVEAMSERLVALGLLGETHRVFDMTVLDAVRRFQVSCGRRPGIAATPEMLRLLEARLARLSAGETDAQMAKALELCRQA